MRESAFSDCSSRSRALLASDVLDNEAGLFELTADDLRRWSVGEPVDLTDRPAHAVTDRARQAFPDDDEEELEYAAMGWAAQSTAAPGASSARGRLVVAALDVPGPWIRPVGGDDPDRGFEIVVEGTLPRRYLVALHVDDTSPAGADASSAEELSWYDAGELAQVAELAR